MQPITTPWSDTQKILALFLCIAFVVVIFVWMFFPPRSDQGATAVLNTLVGALSGFVGMVITFYFGSSRNANTKDNTIAQLVAPAAATETVTPASPLPRSTPTG